MRFIGQNLPRHMGVCYRYTINRSLFFCLMHIGFEPMTQVFNLLRLSYGLSNWPLYQCKRQVCDPDGTRTHDSHIKSVVLYQLSYGVIKRENGLTVKEWSEDTHIPLLWGLFTALHQANILPIFQISHVFLRHCYVFKTLCTYPIYFFQVPKVGLEPTRLL